MQISPDGSYLIVGCAYESLQIFDIIDINNVFSAVWPVLSGTGGPITPRYACVFPGGITGSGYADGSSLLAWVQTNATDSTTTLNALTYPNPPQIVAFPSPDDSNGCASTAQAHVISIAGSAIRKYNTADTSTPLSTTPTNCPVAGWAGTLLKSELIYHGRDPVCNCPDKATKPCPPGIVLSAQEGDISDIMKPYQGFYMEGREFLEGLNGKLITAFSNVTVPVALIYDDPNVTGAVRPCPNGTWSLGVNDSKILGKIAVIHYNFGWRSSCGIGAAEFLARLADGGAAGFFLGLRPGSRNTIVVTPPYDFPIVALQFRVVDDIVSALQLQPLGLTPSPTPTSASAVVYLPPLVALLMSALARVLFVE